MLSVAIWFVTLGLGWHVFSSAAESKNDGRRTIGRAIGLYMVTVSLLATLFMLGKLVMANCPYGKSCPIMQMCRMK